MKIVTLASSFNRKKYTLESLASLHRQTLLSSVELVHVLVDDNSSDGTLEAVESRFPSVHVLKGNGDLYWSGSMRLGWNYITDNIFSIDYLYVYNDDINLFSNAIYELLKLSQSFHDPNSHIVVGAFCDGITNQVTYGGLRRSSWLHPLKFSLVEPHKTQSLSLDTLNMNSALIPFHILNTIEFIPAYFIHGGADYDFGLRARKRGFYINLSNSYVGTCSRNFHKENWLLASSSLLDSYRTLCSAKHQPINSRFHYYRSHGGAAWFILFLLPYISLPFKFILYRIKKHAL
ncbi:glycosyltransferase family 2 protein [Synechococcus sp. N5]|uniref:glycosyltransferase family 2 protein n=1 Tax=Synechococcus sp. N5 TaxID=2575515 RepID=UPI000E0F743B|nr:glycosyltransferase [Synechococcus sp. N5]